MMLTTRSQLSCSIILVEEEEAGGTNQITTKYFLW